jgi:hypothetical protein
LSKNFSNFKNQQVQKSATTKISNYKNQQLKKSATPKSKKSAAPKKQLEKIKNF